jgi:hypothetical protein
VQNGSQGDLANNQDANVDDIVLKRIEDLLSRASSENLASGEVAREIYFGTLGIVETVYGLTSPQIDAVREINLRVTNLKMTLDYKNETLVGELRGALTAMKAEIEGGLLRSIRDEARGE